MATQNIAAQLLSDLKRDFGLTDAQAAGVVGNLIHESGGFQSLQEQNPSSGRGGFGYAQWTGARRNAFENFAAQNGLDPTSYEANYGYLKHELNTEPYERRQFDTVKNAKTAAEAAKLVSDNFLRPGNPNIAARQNYANQALGYAGSPVPTRDIPNVVGTQLDVTRPRIAPTPASVEDRVTARNTAPQPVSPLQAALNERAALERAKLVYPSGGPTRPPTDQIGIANTGRPMLSNPDGSFSTELSMTVTDPRMNGGRPTNIPTIWGGRRLNDEMAMNTALASGQSFTSFPSIAAAENAARYRSANEISAGSAFGDDPMTPATGRVVTAIPSRSPVNDAARRAALTMTQSYAGQDRAPARPSAFNGDPMTPAAGRVVATIPSNGGPSTSIRPSVQITRPAVPSSIATQRNEQLATRQATPRAPNPQSQPTATPRVNPVGSMPTFQALQDMAAQRFDPNAPDRLSPSSAIIPTNVGSIPRSQVNQIGVPALLPAIGPARAPISVPASQLATLQNIAPVPFNRPAFGQAVAPVKSPLTIRVMGSNTIPYPQVRQVPQRVAPVPMPTIDRTAQMLQRGRDAVSQSGDTSVGNQRDAAEARSSGAGGRTRRY